MRDCSAFGPVSTVPPPSLGTSSLISNKLVTQEMCLDKHWKEVLFNIQMIFSVFEVCFAALSCICPRSLSIACANFGNTV